MRKDNTFPFHIEKQQEVLFKNIILKLSRMVIPFLKKQFLQEQKKIKLDAENFGELENELTENLKYSLMAEGYIGNEIEKVALLLDSWAYRKTEKAIKKVQLITKTKPIIPIIFEKENPLIDDFINTYIKNNIELVGTLGREFIPEISNLASQTFLEGGDIKVLSKRLVEFTNNNVSRAEFWARDQVGTAYTEFTKARQTQAGFNNYIWRTVGDSHVRGNDPKDDTSHVALNGRIFSWKEGARMTGQLSNPIAKHPGEDYNCRCTPEPTNQEVT